jgi:hypothetical protein
VQLKGGHAGYDQAGGEPARQHQSPEARTGRPGDAGIGEQPERGGTREDHPSKAYQEPQPVPGREGEQHRGGECRCEQERVAGNAGCGLAAGRKRERRQRQ